MRQISELLRGMGRIASPEREEGGESEGGREEHWEGERERGRGRGGEKGVLGKGEGETSVWVGEREGEGESDKGEEY